MLQSMGSQRVRHDRATELKLNRVLPGSSEGASLFCRINISNYGTKEIMKKQSLSFLSLLEISMTEVSLRQQGNICPSQI